MPAISKYRPLEDALVAAFVDDLHRRTADFYEDFFCTHRRIALHFLIWIDLTARRRPSDLGRSTVSGTA